MVYYFCICAYYPYWKIENKFYFLAVFSKHFLIAYLALHTFHFWYHHKSMSFPKPPFLSQCIEELPKFITSISVDYCLKEKSCREDQVKLLILLSYGVMNIIILTVYYESRECGTANTIPLISYATL